jgi:hypothetical protein
MPEACGSARWAIPEGHMPAASTGPEPAMTSHETACLLAFVLPLILATGVLLFRRHPAAPVLLFMVGFVYADTRPADIGEGVIWATVTAVSAGWLSIVFR